jgi:uncharacterized protein DUF6542
VAADHRSALPHLPGIPWWGAAIVASTLTAVGFAYDAGTGNNALGGVFVTFYVLGCVAAVLAVRQSGLFTAVIQPPLILFIAVPFAYFVFHGSTFTGIKDTLINCGYPLIERFPLMFFTTATVLLIGMVRWYLGAAARRGTAKETPADAPEETAEEATATAPKPRRSARSTKARVDRAAAAAAAAEAMDDQAPRPPRKSPRTAPTTSQRSSGAAAGTGSRRSRHSRPPETEIIEPVSDRPRRRSAPPSDPPVEPRRRARAGEPREREPRDREPRDREPRDRRPLPPLDRRNPTDRAERPDRYDRERPQRRERPDERSGRPERPQRRPRSADYESFEPPPTNRTNGASGTHHPVSRVRYRGADDGESRVEQRTRPRRSRHAAPDSWEYDS